jgi:23S rRNA (guanosine2251-2'-O)-methyltransferase
MDARKGHPMSRKRPPPKSERRDAPRPSAPATRTFDKDAASPRETRDPEARLRDVSPWQGRGGAKPGKSTAPQPKSDTGNAARFRDRKASAGRGRGSPPRTPSDVSLIYGFHAVREALRSTHRVCLRLMVTQAAAEKLATDIAAKGVPADVVEMDEIAARLPHDSVHQGALLEARPLEPIDIEDLPENGFVLVLDQITDPHNVGAILRTAAAFGVDAIVTTERHSPALGGVLAKSASGALEHVPMVIVTNLARALEKLGDMNFQRIGLDSEGPDSLEAASLSRPLALVLGAEGKGLRRLSRENCDLLARIDMPGPIKSLNVSNACAVALTIARMKMSATA